MSLLVVGLSHRSAPVSVLERAVARRGRRGQAAARTSLRQRPRQRGAGRSSTCNRIELYAEVDKFHGGVAELSELLARHGGVDLDELTPHLYVHYEDRAVAAPVLGGLRPGLDGRRRGPGPRPDRARAARRAGAHTAGRLLNDLFQQALRVGKRAHTETGIDRAGPVPGHRRAGARPSAVVGRRRRAPSVLVVGAGCDERARRDSRRPVRRGARHDRQPHARPSASASRTAVGGRGRRAGRRCPLRSPPRTSSCPAPAPSGTCSAPTCSRQPWPRDRRPAARSSCSTWRCPATSTPRPRARRRRRRRPRGAGRGAGRPASRRRRRRGPRDRCRRGRAPSSAGSARSVSRRPWSPCARWPPRSCGPSWSGSTGGCPDLDDRERAEIAQTVTRVVDKLLHAPTVRVKELAERARRARPTPTRCASCSTWTRGGRGGHPGRCRTRPVAATPVTGATRRPAAGHPRAARWPPPSPVGSPTR